MFRGRAYGLPLKTAASLSLIGFFFTPRPFSDWNTNNQEREKQAMNHKIAKAFTYLSILSACATPPNSMEMRELQTYKQKNLYVEEKDPTIGVILGFLPGGGSFYVREYGYGVINLLTWPTSILWDPISGANGAQSINYVATKTYVNQLKQKELDALDEQLKLSQIDSKAYTLEKSKIDRKYAGTF
ncbi:MAG: hypothetical protein LBO78_01365 [Rickettsiales bacterium]|jgi:hypothetical protein|nr:hypothetical protein [Rickettsiales bacterium]